jgi:hypothetical protein
MVEGIVRRIKPVTERNSAYISPRLLGRDKPSLEFEHTVDPLLTMKGIK